MAYGGACSSSRELLDTLFAALARAVEWCIGKFRSRELASTLWALETVQQWDALLFKVLARVVERHVCAFNSQDVASTA